MIGIYTTNILYYTSIHKGRANIFPQKGGSKMKNSMYEMFQQFMRKGMKGRDGYEIVFPYKDGFVLRSEGGNEYLEECRIIVWKNGKVVFRKQWKKGEEESNLNISFALKKQRIMLVYDGEETVYHFGLKNEDKDSEMAMVYYQSDITGTLVMASSKCPKVQMLNYVLNEPETDAVAEVLGMMWGTLEETSKDCEEEEGNI